MIRTNSLGARAMNTTCGLNFTCFVEKLKNLGNYNAEYSANSTMYNGLCNDEEFCWHNDPLEVTMKALALFLIMLFGIPGNLSIIIIIMKNRLLRKQPNNLFLLNMAVADLLNLTVNTTLFFFEPDIIFRRFYYLGPFLCKLTPLLLIYMFVWGALSLTFLTICRVLGILFPKLADFLTFHRLVTFLTIAFIHFAALVSILPSIDHVLWRKSVIYHYSNIDTVICTDLIGIGDPPKYSTGVLVTSYMRHWVLLSVFLIWLPLLIMVTSFGCIYFKLRRSIKSFPYLSIQSRVARSRRKVISMLLILITVEIVCWSPWLYFVISQYVYMKGEQQEEPEPPNQVKSQGGASILSPLRYYMVFLNSAINPFTYGYGNETMQKAFRITFPFLYKEKPKFKLQRRIGHGVFTFKKAMPKINPEAGTKTQQSLKRIGEVLMSPIIGSFEKSAVVLHPKRPARNLARRVARKISFLGNRNGTQNSCNTVTSAITNANDLKPTSTPQIQIRNEPTETICEVDIHLSINVSPDSSVSVSPNIRYRKRSGGDQPIQRKLSRNRKRAYSNAGPLKDRKYSSTEV